MTIETRECRIVFILIITLNAIRSSVTYLDDIVIALCRIPSPRMEQCWRKKLRQVKPYTIIKLLFAESADSI